MGQQCRRGNAPKRYASCSCSIVVILTCVLAVRAERGGGERWVGNAAGDAAGNAPPRVAGLPHAWRGAPATPAQPSRSGRTSAVCRFLIRGGSLPHNLCRPFWHHRLQPRPAHSRSRQAYIGKTRV